jgi:hypothetical protein
MRKIMVAVLLAAVAGCGIPIEEFQRITAGRIGCPPQSITIFNQQIGASTASWTAACQGKIYMCSGKDVFDEVACTAAP